MLFSFYCIFLRNALDFSLTFRSQRKASGDGKSKANVEVKALLKQASQLDNNGTSRYWKTQWNHRKNLIYFLSPLNRSQRNVSGDKKSQHKQAELHEQSAPKNDSGDKTSQTESKDALAQVGLDKSKAPIKGMGKAENQPNEPKEKPR